MESGRIGWCFIKEHDTVILSKIVQYCARIEDALNRCGRSYTAFCGDVLYQDACCMCVVQIGELAGLLSEDVKKQSASIPWRIIKDTRNFYVHAYGSIDLESVWKTLLSDIPVLSDECKSLLRSKA